MRIVQKDSHVVQFCALREGDVFLDVDNTPYMKVRPYDDFDAVRLSDGLLDGFPPDLVVKACPDAFLTLEGE